MFHTHGRILGWALALLCLASTLAFAQDDSPVSRGVVATVTTLDATTGMATLKTEEGRVFEVQKRSRWKKGSKVMCNKQNLRGRQQLRNYRLWQ